MSLFQTIENVEQKVEQFIAAIFPVVNLIKPEAALILKELDIALGIINYAASKAESVQNQSHLTSIATALASNPEAVKPFLDKIIFGNTSLGTVVAGATVVAQSVQNIQNVVQGKPLEVNSFPQQLPVAHSSGGDA